MGKTYTSMRGKEIDMEKLSIRNELLPAVGNLKINARGDKLGPGGKIVKTKEELLQDHYKNNPRSVHDTTTTRKK